VRGVGVGVAAVTVTNTVTLVQSPAPGAGAEKAPEKKRVTCEYVPYSFCDYGGWDKGGVRKCFALLRGAKVEKGMVTEHGMCVDLTEYAIRFVSDDGREHFIYRNDNGISADLAESEKPEKIKR